MTNLMTIPNIITGMRLLGAIGLIFTKPLSIAFYVLYTFCGVTDVLDGWIARATKSCSEFGAKLDSVADLVFYIIMGLKILPYLIKELPLILWCVCCAVLVTRAVNYIIAAVKFKCFAAIHTYLNKATGLLVFAVPYFILAHQEVLSCTILAVVSIVATVEELGIHLSAKSYQMNRKSIFLTPR